MESSFQGLNVDQSIDIRGVERPASYLKTVERLGQMAEHEVLEVYLDEGEALRTIPFGLRAEGHEILVSEPIQNGVRLLIRKRNLLQ